MTSAGIDPSQDLVERRKAKGLSLVEIAAATRINIRYLKAIERGAFQELPGGVYTESYIRQYARAVDDTDGALLDYYREVFAPREAPPADAMEPKAWQDRVLKAVWSTLGLAPDLPLRASRRRDS
jgi:cytoskeletal protein RodZ